MCIATPGAEIVPFSPEEAMAPARSVIVTPRVEPLTLDCERGDSLGAKHAGSTTAPARSTHANGAQCRLGTVWRTLLAILANAPFAARPNAAVRISVAWRTDNGASADGHVGDSTPPKGAYCQMRPMVNTGSGTNVALTRELISRARWARAIGRYGRGPLDDGFGSDASAGLRLVRRRICKRGQYGSRPTRGRHQELACSGLRPRARPASRDSAYEGRLLAKRRCRNEAVPDQGTAVGRTIRRTISSITAVPRRTLASDIRSLFPCRPPACSTGTRKGA